MLLTRLARRRCFCRRLSVKRQSVCVILKTRSPQWRGSHPNQFPKLIQKNCATLIAGSSAWCLVRMRRLMHCQQQLSCPEPDCVKKTNQLDVICSPARQVSARPRSLASSLILWALNFLDLTCRNIWNVTLYLGYWVRLPDMLVSIRAVF